jgi:type III secretion system-like peptide-binding chaperone
VTVTFEDALFLLTGALDEGVVVVFEEAARPRRYLQFLQEPDTLHAELVSDHFLPPELALGPAAATRLTALGWQPPGGDEENWYTDLAWPAPAEAYRQLARQVVATFTEVLGIARPADLRYQAWQSDTGRTLRLDALTGLDALGLTRVPDPATAPSALGAVAEAPSAPGVAPEGPPVQRHRPVRSGDDQPGGGGEPRGQR